MTNKISGGKPRIVDEVQSRLNTFTKCSEAHEAARKALDELAAKNVELADRPAHEERRQVLLTQYKKTVDELKASAQKVRDKTNSHHIDKYFRPRRDGINKTLRAGPKDHYYIHPAHKAYLVEIHDVAKEIVTSDYDTPITQAQNESKARKAEALASIEFSQIDQTFPACRERLLIENPAEYLRQAALYQYNLLEKNDATAVVAFGTSWMKNLPKEATWEQVANMSLIVLEGRNADKSVDLTEYRDAVKQWLNEHPLPETLDSVNPPPDQATSPSGQRTYVLGLLHFNNQQLDLSPEAFQLYKSCGSLYPDQHVWKIAQAYYHISKLQWAEAEQILADLPKDDDAVRDTQKFLKVTHAHYHVDHLEWTEAEQLLADLPKDDASVIYTQKYLKVAHARYHIDRLQWVQAKKMLADLPKDDDSVRAAQRDLDNNLRDRFSSLALDVGVTALSRFTPSSIRESTTGDIALTTLHLGINGVIRQIWVRNSPPLSLSSQIHMAGDVIDCAVRNIPFPTSVQRFESFASYTLRTGYASWTFKDPLQTAWNLRDPLQLSLPSVMNLGSLLISASQSYDAWREIRRPAVTQASLSTFQLIASDVTLGVVLASYSDLLPVMASSVGANSLVDRVSIDSGSEDKESSKGKWVVGALLIGSVAYRIYRDYPYLWAAATMRDMEYYSSQGDQERVQEILAEAKNKYFVSRVIPTVQDYALFTKSLKDYPRCLEDPARYKEFLMQLDLVLNILKTSSHYRGARNNLLVKKIEVAIRKQDKVRLSEVMKEKTDSKVTKRGFQFFLNWTFNLALRDPAAAYSLIADMKPEFPASFHPASDTFLKLLQEHSGSLQEWTQLDVSTRQQNTPASAQIDRWNNALPKLQAFFSQNDDETGAYQVLQYYKLLIAFAQIDKTDVTQAYFEKSTPELHQRFAYALVQCTRRPRKEGLTKAQMHLLATDLLKRAQKINSFKYKELIQNYEHFFSLISSSPLQKDAVLLEMQKLESCIAGLDSQDACHQEFRVFFESCKIIISLDAGQYDRAKELLAQENTDLKVPDEVAALLFERMRMRVQDNGTEAGQSDLRALIKNLGSWQHQELFIVYHAYLVCGPSLEAQVEGLTAVINQAKSIEQLSEFTVILQLRRHPKEFKLQLSQGDFVAAKELLNTSMPENLRLELCDTLFGYFVYRREQQRATTVPLREIAASLQSLNTHFAAPNSETIQSYVDLLVLLASIEGKKDIAARQYARRSLIAFIEKLTSIQCPIPELLKHEMVNILLETARLAKEIGRRNIGLEALDAIRHVGMEDEQLEQYKEYIYVLTGLLNT